MLTDGGEVKVQGSRLEKESKVKGDANHKDERDTVGDASC